MDYVSCGGINWTWYLGFEYVNGKVKILSYDRLHNERDYTQPKASGTGRVIENSDRTVIGVMIGGTCFDVENPKHVFEYPA